METPFRVEYPNGNFFEVDIGPILELDARKAEIPAVNKMTAPGLMRAMEDGFSLAGKQHAYALLEQTILQGMIDRRRAEVSLDIAPEILKQKGLLTSRAPAGTEKQCESILALDVPMGKLKACLAQLETLTNLLKVHMRGFEMAFSAIKKATDNQMGGSFLTAEAAETLIKRGTTPQGGIVVDANVGAAPRSDGGFVGRVANDIKLDAGDDEVDYSQYGIQTTKVKHY